MTVQSDGAVRHELVVDLPPEEAFWKFADLDKIKPREHNMLAVPIAETVLEPHAGGDLYDRGVDGTICRWGRVLTFDPPHTLAFSWDIGPDWQVTSDLTVPARSRSPSPAKTTTAPASPWSTATSTGTVRVGNRYKPGSTRRTAGPSTSAGTRPSRATNWPHEQA